MLVEIGRPDRDRRPLRRDRQDAAADAALKGARGYGANDFKIPLTRRTLRAVMAQATRA